MYIVYPEQGNLCPGTCYGLGRERGRGRLVCTVGIIVSSRFFKINSAICYINRTDDMFMFCSRPC